MITHPNVKLNIGLNVLRKRPDNFHDLKTLFVPFPDIYDTLEIIPGDDYSKTSAHIFSSYQTSQIAQGISCDGKLMITIARREGVDWNPLKDLVARAYGLLSEDFKLPPVKIFLEKTSPVGAGLGGGSSDAAFALVMVRDLFSLPLSDAQLADYASKLGSDCAFFIYNRPMMGQGRGEILTPFDLSLDGYEIRVIVPENIAISTADAYRGIVPAEPPEDLDYALKRPLEQWEGHVVNDFETTVFAKYPTLAKVKEELYSEGAVYASMSGSGSACYGIFKK